MPSGFLGAGIGPRAIARRAAAGNGLLNNLVYFYALNEAGGANNALDLHSNALHLTQNSSPGADTGKVYATARTFDGSADYFSRASETLLRTGDVDFTLAAWVYSTNFTDFDSFVEKSDGSPATSEWLFGYRVSTINRVRFAVTAGGVLSTILYANNFGPLSNDTWYLCFAWHDAANNLLGMQINDAAPDTISHSAGVTANNMRVTVGSNGNSTPDAASFFTGRIGPIAMWKSAPGGGGVLSEAQRAALWNGGAGLTYASFTA